LSSFTPQPFGRKEEITKQLTWLSDKTSTTQIILALAIFLRLCNFE
jgi:hypothetical protein